MLSWWTIPATASCYLVVGGAWGLRLQDAISGEQWGEPYLLMAADGGDLRFS